MLFSSKERPCQQWVWLKSQLCSWLSVCVRIVFSTHCATIESQFSIRMRISMVLGAQDVVFKQRAPSSTTMHCDWNRNCIYDWRTMLFAWPGSTVRPRPWDSRSEKRRIQNPLKLVFSAQNGQKRFLGLWDVWVRFPPCVIGIWAGNPDG